MIGSSIAKVQSSKLMRVLLHLQGLEVCPQTSGYDKAVLVSASEFDTLIDAALLLACMALYDSENNLHAARRWLQSFQQQLLGMLGGGWMARSRVPVSSAQWFLSAAESAWLVQHGVCERLEADAVADATEMHRLVSMVPPPTPATPNQEATVPVCRRLFASQAMTHVVLAPEFVHGVDTPFSPGMASLLKPINLDSMDELLG